ncbi:MAG: glycoside hydrolase family 2 TIM barrel-domain containing protein [Candidatus Thorarchaeota archaeon]
MSVIRDVEKIQMKNELILNNWFFKIFKIAEKEDIINKIGINSPIKDLQPFQIPGSLQSNIVDIIELDPYFEDNMRKLEYLEEFYLFLITEFTLEDHQSDYQLTFDYIDTMAQIYLNGIEIRNTSSAFIQYQFHLPNDLIEPLNTLVIIISSPKSFVDKEIEPLGIVYKDRVFVRRPAYNYGWDFAPRSLLIGMGDVKISFEREISYSDLYIKTESISEDAAELSVTVIINSEIEGKTEFILKINDLIKNKPVFKDEFSLNLNLGFNEMNRSFKINNFQLWWPNGTGAQPIYELTLLEKNQKSNIKGKFGIRTVDLILGDEGEDKFIFKINDKMIFAKGANWVPTDSLTNYGTEEKYRKLLTLAKDANFNMIRIWGGGVVENEIFYEICDELGIMIWHDFQFACSIYPEHKEFLSIVEAEISSIIKRLRNHPSIILWCGSNENEWVDFRNYTNTFREERKIGEKLHQIKRNLCSQLDPSRPYWRTSPWNLSAENSYETNPNSMDEGNYHDWRIWHGVDQPNSEPPEYEEYANNRAKFISEFGIQSLPSIQTVNKIFSKQTQLKPNKIWEFHNCDIHKITVNLKKMGDPKNIEEWIIFTQAAQAFGMKYAVETWRARKFHTAGALIWQFNEPWPTICWSLIDYFDIPKMAYWLIKDCFQPVIVVKDPNKNNLIIVNDLLIDIRGNLKIRIYKSNGIIVQDENHEISIKSNYKTYFNLGSLTINKDEFLWAQFIYKDITAENTVFPCEPKDMNFLDPDIHAKVENKILTLVSKDFAFLVHLPDEIEPNKNYFHLIPNIPKKIKLKNILEDKKLKVRIWSNPPKYIFLD